jgi:hypothetical protein
MRWVVLLSPIFRMRKWRDRSVKEFDMNKPREQVLCFQNPCLACIWGEDRRDISLVGEPVDLRQNGKNPEGMLAADPQMPKPHRVVLQHMFNAMGLVKGMQTFQQECGPALGTMTTSSHHQFSLTGFCFPIQFAV